MFSGGYVTGVSPYAMVAKGGEGSKIEGAAEDKVSNREAPPHPNRLAVVVDSMHERKTEMARRADGGFVALPGGYGTLEEVRRIAIIFVCYLIHYRYSCWKSRLGLNWQCTKSVSIISSSRKD